MLSAVYIKGFKTFSRPVRLPLESGVTAIIGPNGSGKSNITDAVLFACGEQRPAVLRASGMGDLIFSGSDGQSAAALAEVTLAFDNSSGRVELPYAEVSVTRRISREGGSEYLINGSRARLSDVRSVVEQAGVGAHSILRQGAVDSIVSGGAPACRGALEEAAGLGVFRRRRRETGRRLEQAQERLERTRQLEEELGGQLQRLRREAEAAREYREVESRLREYSLAHLYRMATRDTGPLSKELTAVRTRVEELSAERDEISRREGELAKGVEDLEGEEQALEDLSERIENLLEGLRARSASIERALYRMEEVLRGASERVRRISELQAELKEVRGYIAEMESRREADLISAEREKLTAAEAEEGRLRSEHASAASQRARLSEEVAALKERVEKLTSASGSSSEVDLEGLRRLLESLESHSVDGHEERISRVRAALDGCRKQRERCLGELEHRRGRLSALIGRTEARLGSLQRNEASGGTRLYEVVRPRPGFERAVEAALGDLASGVLVEDLREGIKLLSGHERVVVRLDVAEVEENGATGGLSLFECVEVTDSRYRGAVERLLGGIFLVENPAAESLSNGYVAVTRDGMRLTRTGGSLAAPGGDLERESLLAGERRRLRDLQGIPQNALEDLEGQLEAAGARLADLSTDVGAMESMVGETARLHRALLPVSHRRVERLRREREEQRLYTDRLRQATRELSEAHENLSCARREEQELHDRLQQASFELQGRRKSYQQREMDDSRIQAQIQEARAREKHLVEELKRARNFPLEELRRKVSAGTEASALCDGLIEACRSRSESVRRRRRETAATRRRLSSEMNTLSHRSSELSEDLASTRAETTRLESELNRARNAADRAQAELFEEWGATLEEGREHAASIPASEDDERHTLSRRLKSFGDVNLLSITQEEEIRQRYDFTREQRQDAEEAANELTRIIHEVDAEIEQRFDGLFGRVKGAFSGMVPRMLEGATGSLELTEEGVEIGVRLGRKGWRPLRVLSGGERSLLALAFLFSILLSRLEDGNGGVFCLLDEAEAALDDLNLARFLAVIDSYRMDGQFMLITHQKRTMATADVLYGVAQDATGASNVVSKRLSGD